MSAPVASRRAILAGLSAAPIMAVPALPAIAAAPSPDAAIIAMAAHVKALAARENRLHLRMIDLDDRAFVAAGKQMPPAPEYDPPSLDERTGLMMLECASKLLGIPFDPAAAQRLALIDEESKRLEEGRKPVLAAWEQRHEEVRNPIAVRAARRLHNRANRKLIDAANDLGEMRPATLEGLVAKASAVRLNRDGYPDEDWAEYLLAFIIEDLRVIGGAS